MTEPNALNNQPENLNLFEGTRFKMVFTRLSTVAFFTQRVDIPSVSLGEAIFPTPFKDISIPGDKLIYDKFNLSFVVDEDLQNYIALYGWIQGLGFPENYQQYKTLRETRVDLRPRKGHLYSDATLHLLTNNYNPNIQILFKNMFPISLSPITLDSTEMTNESKQLDSVFAYERYDIEVL